MSEHFDMNPDDITVTENPTIYSPADKILHTIISEIFELSGDDYVIGTFEEFKDDILCHGDFKQSDLIYVRHSGFLIPQPVLELFFSNFLEEYANEDCELGKLPEEFATYKLWDFAYMFTVLHHYNLIIPTRDTTTSPGAEKYGDIMMDVIDKYFVEVAEFINS